MLATVSTHALQVVTLLTLRPHARVDLALQKIKDLATNVKRREAFQKRLIGNLPAAAACAGASTPQPASPGRAGGSADLGDPAEAPVPAAPVPPEPVQQQVLFPALRAVRTPYHVDAQYKQRPCPCQDDVCPCVAARMLDFLCGVVLRSLCGAVQSCAAAFNGADIGQGLRPACEAVFSRWGRAGALSADGLAREALLGGWLAAHHLR